MASAHRREKDRGLRRAWCCSFGVGPERAEPSHRPRATANPTAPPSNNATHGHRNQHAPKKNKHLPGSIHSSPSPTSRIGRGLIDPRRILSPGRVSPIDSDAGNNPPPPPLPPVVAPEVSVGGTGGGKERGSNLRLVLRGGGGKRLVLELDSDVLCANSLFFSTLVLDSRRKVDDASSSSSVECRKIEVANIADLGVFRETIELMFHKDLPKSLLNSGVSRAIDILEVSSTIMFERGVMSCLKYLEAVPWTEGDEEKLKNLLARCTFDEAMIQDVLARLFTQKPIQSEGLALHLVHSVANGEIASARKEMRTLVNGLLSRSSVYQKDPAGISKDGLYNICYSCMNLLVELFGEASGLTKVDETNVMEMPKPLIERISKQVDNLNWLLEILVDLEMAEDFVNLWAKQNELVKMHEITSPMVRYELSRISAYILIALGKGRLQCGGSMRHGVLSLWFIPMLSDFGWLQRCPKGLDMRMLEEGLGQTLLTLSLKQQESFFVEWFKCFACRGTECPNLSRAFQVWWRRSFVKPAEVRSMQTPRGYQNLLFEEDEQEL